MKQTFLQGHPHFQRRGSASLTGCVMAMSDGAPYTVPVTIFVDDDREGTTPPAVWVNKVPGIDLVETPHVRATTGEVIPSALPSLSAWHSTHRQLGPRSLDLLYDDLSLAFSLYSPIVEANGEVPDGAEEAPRQRRLVGRETLTPDACPPPPQQTDASPATPLEPQCAVCLSAPPTHVFVPCGHMCCCGSCAALIRQCCICRKDISTSVRVYQS